MTESTQPARRAVLHTNHGDIAVNLFPDHAPKTVENFTGLATGAKEYRKPNASGGNSGPSGRAAHQPRRHHGGALP